MNPELDITEWIDHEDGSATLKIDMNLDMLLVLARAGFSAIVKEAIDKHGYPYTEGTGDAEAGG